MKYVSLFFSVCLVAVCCYFVFKQIKGIVTAIKDKKDKKKGGE